MKRAFIFDMDGVIVDSEPLHTATKMETFHHFGIPFEERRLEQYAGRTSKELFSDALADCPTALTWKDLADYKHRLYIDRLTHAADIVPIPGVVQLIARLHAKGNLLAVASSTGRNIIEMVLRRFGVRPYFTAVISGAELPRSKPDPAIYRKAADSLGIVPAHCTVIEDAAAGIAAAKAAGMTCIAYHNPNSGNQDLSRADWIAESFDMIES